MVHRIRRLAPVAILSAIGLLLAGCTASTPAPKASSSTSLKGGAPLLVWSRSDPTAAATYEKVFAAFTKKTGVEVDYKPVADFDVQLQALASQKKLPDVFINDAGSLGAYQSQGFLLPVDKSKLSNASKVSDESWKQNIGLDGKTYGVPWSRQAVVTIVRKDWREKLGMPVPKTWDQLSDLAHAFATEDPDGDGKADTYGMVVPGSATNAYLARWATPYFYQAGGDFLKSTGKGKYTSVVDSAANVKAMEFVKKQFCTAGNVVPGSVNYQTKDTPFFQQGSAGIYVTGAYNLNLFDQGVGKENVEVIPMPKGPKNSLSWAEGEDIYFGAASKQSAKQYALADYLISAEAQKIGMDSPTQGGAGPFVSVVRLPVNTSITVGKVYGDPRWQTTADSYETSKAYPWNIDFIPFRQALADGMNAMVADCGSDVKAGMKKIDEQFRQQLQTEGLAK